MFDKIQTMIKGKIMSYIIGGIVSYFGSTLFLILLVFLLLLGVGGVAVYKSLPEENSPLSQCVGGDYGGDISPDKVKNVFEKNASGTKLEGKGKYIVKSAEKHKIDPKIFMAIIAMETGWGKSVDDRNNVAGMMGSGDLFHFDSVEEGIDAAAKNLYDLYFKLGLNTPEKIGPKYAPIGAGNDPSDKNSNWIPNVKKTVVTLSSDDDKGDKKEEKKESSASDDCGSVELSGDASKLAISIAYPRDQHSKANTIPGEPYGQSVAPAKYKEAKKKALAIATMPEGMKDLYASCDRFVATVIIGTTDKDFPWGSTTEQQNYLSKSPKWKQYTKKSQAKPGDVWVTRQNGHVILYVGKYQGKDTIVHASYTEWVARVDNASYLNEDLVDLGGRAYYGYRFVGKK